VCSAKSVRASRHRAELRQALGRGSVEAARTMINLGARLIFHGCDIALVKNGLHQLQADFRRELGHRFGRPSTTAGKSYLEG
jgi:hypothetical protein